FTIVSISFVIHQNLNKVLTQWGDSIRMSVFLKEDVEDTQDLVALFKNFNGVDKVDYISKEEAAKLFKEQMNSYVPELIFDSEFQNPLPSSYEIKFNEDWSQLKFNEIANFAQMLLKEPFVEDVSYGQSWVKNYASVVDKFNTSSWLLVVVLLLGSMFVIGNSIRSSISQRKEEIEILELIGSTPAAIRAPYLFEGFLLGFIASLIAIIVSYIIFRWQLEVFDSGVGILGGKKSMEFLTLQKQLLIIFIGSSFGVLGAYFCVTKINNGWAALQAES
ncbi:MAG: permease-like cell division protein FtsX, partial [Bdellovibrionales bacterium]|nr:permease-like cell division protein FtsX [Bdellovibrionales bacterium]